MIGLILALGGANTGGAAGTSSDFTVSKTTEDSFSDLSTLIDGVTNLNGNDVIVTLSGTVETPEEHNIDSERSYFKKAYNGKVRFEAAATGSIGTEQVASIVGNDDGQLVFDNDVDYEFNFLRLAVTSADTQRQNPLLFRNTQSVKFYRCYIDLDSINNEAHIGEGGGDVVFVECVFNGSLTQISNLWNNCRNLSIYDCAINERVLTNGLKGFGKILSEGGLFTNKVAIGSPGKVIGETVGITEFYLDAVSISDITATTAQINARFSDIGTIYWGVYTNGSAVPTSAELIGGSGTGFLVGGTIDVTSGNENTILNDAIDSVIAAGTDYDVYAIAGDSLSRNFSSMRFVEFTTAAPQLNAPVITGIDVTSATSLTVNFTDPNTSPNEVSFTLQHALNNTFDSDLVEVTGIAADSIAHLIESLTTDVERFVRVMAIAGAGALNSPWSNIVSATPTSSVSPIMTFQTTSSSATWTPVITPAAGTLIWEVVGYGQQESNAPSFDLSGNTANDTLTVNVYANDVLQDETVTAVNLSSLNISGAAPSFEYFTMNATFLAYVNGDMTGSFIFSTNANILNSYRIFSSALTAIDLTNATLNGQVSWQGSNISSINMGSNSHVTANFEAQYNSFSTLDLSNTTINGSTINLSSNSPLSQFKMPTFTTALRSLLLSSCALPASSAEYDTPDSIMSKLNTFFTSNAPTGNLTIDVSGGTNGALTNGASNADLLALQTLFSGYTLTVNYN